MRLSAAGRLGVTRKIFVRALSASASRLSWISVATCSKVFSTSPLCARTGITKRHKRDKRHKRRRALYPFCALCAFLWLLFAEFLLIYLALTFFDRDDPVHAEVRDL